MAHKKIAVVLFNLGGPDSLSSVKPFLFNLFNDKAIIDSPSWIRWCIAKLISSRRDKTAQDIYSHMGGKSPIVEQTRDQAIALESLLKDEGYQVKVFVSMRYWHPFSEQIIQEVKDFDPEEVILLPLYPQFSTTTVESSLDDWERVTRKTGYRPSTRKILSHHREPDYIQAHVDLIRPFLAQGNTKKRILFSAHGLPKKIADKPTEIYQRHIEETVAAIIVQLDELQDHQICYQSRVGPLEWIGPSTEDALQKAADDEVSVVVVPIAFVSEHSETLVELDIEYADLAAKLGVPYYVRVPALGTHPFYMKSLATICNYVLGDQYNEFSGIEASHPSRDNDIIDELHFDR